MPTIRITDERQKKLEKKAVEVTLLAQKPVAISLIINALIDEKLENFSAKEINAFLMNNNK